MNLRRKFVDYHVHSNQSCDGKFTIFEMCQKAVELGMDEIGFSEHVDFEPTDLGFGFFNYDRYTAEIKSAQEFFENRLVIRKGVEIDYQRCFEGDIKEWLRGKRFDFIVGSVHYLNHEIIGHPMVMKKDLGKIYDAYFNEVAWSVESGLFDVVGHFDLVRRYVDVRKFELNKLDYWRGVRAVLRQIVKRKVYFEINSRKLKEASKDPIPNRRIVEEFIENGGELISVGSDAHTTEEIGSGIKEILALLTTYNGNKLKLLFE